MLQKCCPHSALGMWERYLKAIRPRRTWQLRVVLPRLSLQQPKSWFFYQGERNEAFLEKWPMNAFSSSGGWSKHWSLCLALGAPAEGGSRQLCSSGCMPVALVSKFLFGAAPFFVCVRFFFPSLTVPPMVSQLHCTVKCVIFWECTNAFPWHLQGLLWHSVSFWFISA